MERTYPIVLGGKPDDCEVDVAKRKLLIVDDYYNMNKFNDSSRLTRNRAEFDDNASPSESKDTLESSFEIIDMDDYLNSGKGENNMLKGGGSDRPVEFSRPKLVDKDLPECAQSIVKTSDNNSSDSDGDEWGITNKNGVGSLMVSWIGNSDPGSSSPKSPQSIPLSTILTSPANKAVVKESTGMLDITFSSNAAIPEDMFMKTTLSADITSDVNLGSTAASCDDQDCDESEYSGPNSDFDQGHSSASEDSESELWQSAYGSMMKFNAMNVKAASDEVLNTAKNSDTLLSETSYKLDGNNESYPAEKPTDYSKFKESQTISHQSENDQSNEHQDENRSEKAEGHQNVKWYKGVDQNNRPSGGVDVLPHYIPIVPLSSYGEGAINSVNLIPDIPNATPRADVAEDGSSLSKEIANNTYIKSRVVIKRMNLSWKWFDGKDWDGSDETRQRVNSSANGARNGKKTLFPKDSDSADTYKNASMKTLLGIILDDDNDGDYMDVVKPSSPVAWWITEPQQQGQRDNSKNKSVYYIACSRVVETMVEIRLTDFAMRSDTFNSSSPYSANLVIHVHDFELIDHLLSSNLKKLCLTGVQASCIRGKRINQCFVYLCLPLRLETGKSSYRRTFLTMN